jgi:hypothetical protein
MFATVSPPRYLAPESSETSLLGTLVELDVGVYLMATIMVARAWSYYLAQDLLPFLISLCGAKNINCIKEDNSRPERSAVADFLLSCI